MIRSEIDTKLMWTSFSPMSYYVVAKQWHLCIVSISLLLAALAYYEINFHGHACLTFPQDK